MKKNTILFALFLIVSNFAKAQVNQKDHYVKSYVKGNGTVVNGYYATDPNKTINDNYSTYPNINPHTGKIGTKTPDYSNSYNSIDSYERTRNSNSLRSSNSQNDYSSSRPNVNSTNNYPNTRTHINNETTFNSYRW